MPDTNSVAFILLGVIVSSMSEKEIVESSDTVDDEVKEEYDKKANKRASLEEKYQEILGDLQSEDVEASETEEDSSSFFDKFKWNNVRSWLLNTVDGLDERINQNLHTIEGLETKPAMDDESLEEALDSAEEVEEIRFIFADGMKSQWYTWNLEDPTHPLNYIIDYYTENNSISDLFGETVRGVNIYKDQDTGEFRPHIIYPTPYNKKSGHIRFKLYGAIEKLLNNRDTGKQFKVGQISTHKSVHSNAVLPVTSDLKFRNYLSRRALTYIMNFVWSFSLGSLAYILGSWITNYSVGSSMSGPLPTVNVGHFAVMGIILMAFIIPLTIHGIMNIVPYKKPNESSVFFGLIVAGLLLVSPLAIPLAGIVYGGKVLSKWIGSVNQYDPYS